MPAAKKNVPMTMDQKIDLLKHRGGQKVSPGLQKLEFVNGQIKYNDSVFPSTHVVFLSVFQENTYYSGPYDRNKIVPPDCYAYLTKEGAPAVPHADARSPQHDTCAGCPMAEWGSAPNGKAKACRERIKGIVIPYNEDTELLAKQPAVQFRASPTSTQNFGSYQTALDAHGLSPLLVVTELSASVHPKFPNVTSVSYSVVKQLTSEELDVVLAKMDAAEVVNTQPYSEE